MTTHKYDYLKPCATGAWGILGVFSRRAILGILALAFFGLAESQAAIDTSILGQYALLSNGSFNVNKTTVNGNTGVNSGSINSANNDTFNGDFSYKNGTLNLNKNTVTGISKQDLTLGTAINNIATLSGDIAKLAYTLELKGDLKDPTFTGNGGTNVLNLRGNNLNGIVTLNGGADDVFYINVWSNMDLKGVKLADDVDAKNVFWNIVNGQNGNLSGDLNGTFLAFNSSGQATSLNINKATINGNLVAGSLNLSNSTINGISMGQSAVAMAPEASSTAAMAAFAGFLLLSSTRRFWKTKLQGNAA